MRRYNLVPRIVGTDMNVEYEAADEGQVVQADEAVALVEELKQIVREYRESEDHAYCFPDGHDIHTGKPLYDTRCATCRKADEVMK